MAPSDNVLFRAIVVAGTALVGCGSGPHGNSTPATTADAGDASVVSDSGPPPDDAGAADAGAEDGSCPPGSELPVPPCFAIL